MVFVILLVGVAVAADTNDTGIHDSNIKYASKETTTSNMQSGVNSGYSIQNTSKTIVKKADISSGNNTKTANQSTIRNKYIYVNPTSTAASPDGSKNKPYLTISTAVSKASNGYNNIIYLSSGNHVLSSPVQITKTISIIGEGSDKTNITCNQTQGFRMSKNSNLTLRNLKMQGAKYSQGGAVLTAENVILIIDNCVFKNNKANNGAVIFGPGINVKSNITNSIFESNTNLRFGALQLGGYNSIYNINNCTFNKNILTDTDYSHSTGGAAIYASAYATVKVNNSVFKNNKGLWGNAILNGNHANLYVTYSNFTNNIAKENLVGSNRTKGGAIAIGSGYAEIGHCYFANNKADVGGAITINSGETTLIYSCNFQKNIAYIQGGAINNYGTLILKDSKLIKNNATRRGGAILDIGNSEITIQNCMFKNNRVLTSSIKSTSRVPQGGAISISGSCHTFTITDSTFDHNSAYFGGAIYSEIDTLWITLTNTKFINNTSCYGGAIIIAGETTIDVNKNTFSYNRALRKGGAILINGSVQGKFSNSIFKSNYANVSKDGDGGAVYLSCYAKLYFNTCTFDENYANMKGGVIGAASSATINVMKSVFTNNKATTGSIIYVDNSKVYKTIKSNLNILTSTFLKNTGKYIFYSVKAYDGQYNNNLITTSWWGSNVLPSNITYNFKIQNYYVATLNIDDNVINIPWTNNPINYTLNRTKNAGKNLILSIYSIKEGSTLRYTDAFLPERTFIIKENNNKAVTKKLYVYYHLNMNLNKIEITLDNQKIILNIVK